MPNQHQECNHLATVRTQTGSLPDLPGMYRKQHFYFLKDNKHVIHTIALQTARPWAEVDRAEQGCLLGSLHQPGAGPRWTEQGRDACSVHFTSQALGQGGHSRAGTPARLTSAGHHRRVGRWPACPPLCHVTGICPGGVGPQYQANRV